MVPMFAWMEHVLCSTKRNLKVSEDCTDTNQRCSDSRVGPENNRWVTVELQIRASQHKCSTLCTVIDEIGRDELNRTLINENRRLRQVKNLNGCASVQCASRVSSQNPCRLHGCNCLVCGTLAGFLLPTTFFFFFEIACWKCLFPCGRCARKLR